MGDGSEIKFWIDDWLGVGALATYALNPYLSNIDLKNKVEFFPDDYGWNEGFTEGNFAFGL